MIFSELLSGAELTSPIRCGDRTISGVQYDSRKVKQGDCFVAIKGETTDGNKFILNAVSAGAVAVVTDSNPDGEVKPYVGWAQVVAGRGHRALGQISANFYGH